MALLEECLAANERYAASFREGYRPAPPARQLAIVSCMDARMLPDRFLGLELGDAHVIRNAGALVTDDVLRSLIVSHNLLGTRTFFVIGHTDCGVNRYSDSEIRRTVAERTGADAAGIDFHAFDDLDASVRAQVARIEASPYISNDCAVHGFVYHVEDGRLRQVV